MLFLPCRIRFQPLAGQFFGTNSLYVKAPTFPHLRKRRGFFINDFWSARTGGLSAFGFLCPRQYGPFRRHRGRMRKSCFHAARVQKKIPCVPGRPQVVRTAGQGRGLSPRVNRDAPRPDTVPSRLPGACAANGPPAGRWRTRLRCRRHWPPGPWRSGRIWNCPWPGRPGANIR